MPTAAPPSRSRDLRFADNARASTWGIDLTACGIDLTDGGSPPFCVPQLGAGPDRLGSQDCANNQGKPAVQQSTGLLAEAALQARQLEKMTVALRQGRRIAEGRYELVRRIGSGGMAEVWEARDLELDRSVATRFPRQTQDGALRTARFGREARALARLSSPHLVQIYDVGLEADEAFIVMELLHGETLRESLEREGTRSLESARVITSQVTKALTVIHAAGLVHRDIKPSNIFLARTGDDETAKVLDPGVVRALDDEVNATSSGVIIGSPAFMSPEQARGARVDARSDVWSLAVVLFEMLTDEEPLRPRKPIGWRVLPVRCTCRS